MKVRACSRASTPLLFVVCTFADREAKRQKSALRQASVTQRHASPVPLVIVAYMGPHNYTVSVGMPD